MEIDETIKDLIRQNGHLIFENQNLSTINEQLMQQIKMLQNIIQDILNKKGDTNE